VHDVVLSGEVHTEAASVGHAGTGDCVAVAVGIELSKLGLDEGELIGRIGPIGCAIIE